MFFVIFDIIIIVFFGEWDEFFLEEEFFFLDLGFVVFVYGVGWGYGDVICGDVNCMYI